MKDRRENRPQNRQNLVGGLVTTPRNSHESSALVNVTTMPNSRNGNLFSLSIECIQPTRPQVLQRLLPTNRFCHPL